MVPFMTNLMTDTRALAQRRSRANAMFLHEAAADEIQDRLAMVNKSFTSTGIVTGFPAFWGQHFPNATVVMDEDELALARQSHDLVIHAMSLHWANDPVGQMVQSRLALKPDGLFIAACFGGQTLQELRRCLTEAEVTVTGGISPRVAPMAELRDLGGLIQRAGLALPVADIVKLSVAYDDMFHLMRDLRAMGETNALANRLRHPTRRAVFDHAAKLYQQHFGTSEGKVLATFELVMLTGWAPSADQPQPLRPGSAKQRLADALDTNEHPLSH